MKKIFIFVVIVSVCAMLASCITMKNVDLSDRYEKVSYEATCLKILGKVNVRSEPKVMEERGDGDSNSFGMVRKPGCTLEITKAYMTNKELDANGEFYGFLVEEILATPEGREWFPRGIKNDPDGIVWISADYIKVTYPEASHN